MSTPDMRRALLILAAVLMFASLAYRTFEAHRLETVRRQSEQTLKEVAATVALERLWHTKDWKKKLPRLRQMLPQNEIKRFELKGEKLSILLEGVEGKDLNRFLSRLESLPLQIQTLEVQGEKNRYRMECRCEH